MSRVAVIGAGPAGLIAALELAERHHDVVLLEADERVGGMSGSFEIADQRVDYGSHRLHPATDAALMARIRCLLGDDLQTRVRNGRIRLEDRWVGFPLRPGPMLRELPVGFSAKVGFDTLTKPLRRRPPDCFATAIEQRLGPTVADRFYRPCAHKLYGEPAEQLAVELADKRVSATSPLHIIGKALRASRTDGRTFFYPRRSYGQISEALAEAALGAGVDLQLKRPVSRITTDGPITIQAGDHQETADFVLSSMPIERFVNALEPTPDEQLVRAATNLRTRAMVLVYLVLDRPRFTEFDAHYFPDAALHMSRLSEPKNYPRWR